MKKHFYFFRHGQTNENEVGIRYGTGIDAYLTDLGIVQAQKLSEFFKDKDIDVVYSSPYRRAIDTAKIALSDKNVEIITKDELKEAIFWFWDTESEEKKKQINNNFKIIKNCLEHIVKHDERNNIAIASHGGVTRALCYACGLKVDSVKNCQCFHFTLDNDIWEFVEEFETDIKVQNKSDTIK
ncbi:MAG: histidine phosphatase family protein [Alphaproteobacteria bacterium]